MIVKEFDDSRPIPDDKREKAGHFAEKQMAHYLRRAFPEQVKNVLVFNDLRLEHDGEAAQIDHLVLHPYGFIIIESKSVYGVIQVNRQEEFTRTYKNRKQGMPSPIRQAERQRNLLQDFLIANYPHTRKRSTFKNERFKIVIAISEKGAIGDRNRPMELVKADDVPDRVEQIIFDYRPVVSSIRDLMSNDKDKDKRTHESLVSKFKDGELDQLKNFLLDNHTPRQPDSADGSEQGVEQKGRTEAAEAFEPAGNSATAGEAGGRPAGDSVEIADSTGASTDLRDTNHTCDSCDSSNVNIWWNDSRRSYLFKCDDCGADTSIKVFCETCGGVARVSKSKLEFSKKCKVCETTQPYFTNSREM